MARSINNKSKSYLILIILLSMTYIIACKGVRVGTEVGNTSSNSWNELEIYIKGEFSESVLPSEVYEFETGLVPAELSDVANDYYSAGDYSRTNVQEIGVDESDKVKSDGTYLYIAGDSAVHIVNAVPADSMNIISTINVNGTVDSLYLDNNTLIILYEYSSGRGLTWSGSSPCITVGLSYCTPVETRLGVLITDVSDPSSPDWIKEWIIDGWMVSSRLTGSKLHIVQKFLPDLPPLQQIYDGTEEERAEAVAANKAALKDMPLSELIPYYDVINKNGNISRTSPLIIPEDFYRPAESNGGSVISIVTIDLDNPSEDFKSKGLIADAHTVYASTDAIYIASSQWNNETVALGETREYYWTFLYKFSLAGEEATVEGTGEVRGKILNQFSMGEYDDVLRIATASRTSIEGVWGVTNENNIYCLEAGNGSLDIIGSLEGIAPGEDIYAARFIGPHGFMVTFVKVDPLFTIDLSDPSNPVIAGELHVPGYSDYIHPLGNDHLITIGKDTVLDDFGNVWYQGLQLSIFDISDFTNPQLLHSEVIGDRGTESLALYDHKAFTFWDENGLLAIPVDLFEHETEPAYPYTYGEYTFSGLYVYRITTEEGFNYLGRINTDSYIYYGDDWLRGLFIENDVYAVNGETVRSSNIDDIAGTVNTLTFPNSD